MYCYTLVWLPCNCAVLGTLKINILCQLFYKSLWNLCYRAFLIWYVTWVNLMQSIKKFIFVDVISWVGWHEFLNKGSFMQPSMNIRPHYGFPRPACNSEESESCLWTPCSSDHAGFLAFLNNFYDQTKGGRDGCIVDFASSQVLVHYDLCLSHFRESWQLQLPPSGSVIMVVVLHEGVFK